MNARPAPDFPELTRRGLLKGGGALVIGFSLAGLPVSRAAFAQFGPPQGPDMGQIDSWIAIHADNTATALFGFVELGQGCTTALPQIVAEELDLELGQIRIVHHETEITPYQGGTYSSTAIARGRPQVQAAAAEARAELLRRAAEALGAPVAALTVEAGVVCIAADPARRITYGALVGGQPFALALSGTAEPKRPDQYRIIGQSHQRRDMAAKVMGTHDYIQHLRLPGMLHARIIRPTGQRAYASGARVLAVDDGALAAIPGARLIRRNDFLAVVAPREWDAVRAARALKVIWEDGAGLPGNAGLYAAMRAQEAHTNVLKEEGDVAAALAGSSVRTRFAIATPYQAHAPMAPNCALADVRANAAQVWCSSQDIYALRGTLAGLLELQREQVTVQFRESSGTYGHSLYDDAAQGAALISQLAGAPVRLQLNRADEHGWDTYGPAHLGEVEIGADGEGRLSAYVYEGWQHSWSLVETNDQLARGTPARTWPFGPSRSVNPAVCGGMYRIAAQRLVDHELAGEPWLRAAWLRSPLDLSFTFASEQAVDDLAAQLGMDPVDLRRRNIADDRWLGVLDAVAQASNWPEGLRRGKTAEGPVLTGRGVGLGTHLAGWGAAVAEVSVDTASGAVRVTRLWGALDAGCTVNPDIVEAQIEGQLVQTVSRMLLEEVTFDSRAVTSLDWSSYPVARFADCPVITPVIVQRLDKPSSGAGEEVMAAAAAAIANAFCDATGRRMNTFPFTPGRVRECLSQSGLAVQPRRASRAKDSNAPSDIATP